jgi:hypothetical protein
MYMVFNASSASTVKSKTRLSTGLFHEPAVERKEEHHEAEQCLERSSQLLAERSTSRHYRRDRHCE